jgi:hypothetical protein
VTGALTCSVAFADYEVMEAVRVAWRRLGEILVARGLITERDVARALAVQGQTGKRLGETLVELGLISPSQLSDAFVEQQGAGAVKEAGLFSGLWAAVREGHRDEGPGIAAGEHTPLQAGGVTRPGLPVDASNSVSARAGLERTDSKQVGGAADIVHEQAPDELSLEPQLGRPGQLAQIGEREPQVTTPQDQGTHRVEDGAELGTRSEQAEHELAVARLEAARTRAEESLENAQAELADMRARNDEPTPEIQTQLEEALALLLIARSEYELTSARLAETKRHSGAAVTGD